MRKHAFIISLMVLAASPLPSHAQTVPGAACTAGQLNYIRQEGGPETTGVWHLMRCDGANWRQYLSILADGSVGIGESSINGRPLHLLSATDNTAALTILSSGLATGGIGINLGSVSNLSQARIVSYRSTSSSLDSSLRFSTRVGGATAERMRIHENGFVGIGDVAPNVALDVNGDIEFTGTLADMSDRRLKSDITPLSGQLEKVMQLRPVSFVMKDDPKQRVELGLIAQDVEPEFPELVGGGGDVKSLNYLGLIAPLVGAVQELEAENAALRRNYHELSQRMNVLEGKIRPPLTPYNH